MTQWALLPFAYDVFIDRRTVDDMSKTIISKRICWQYLFLEEISLCLFIEKYSINPLYYIHKNTLFAHKNRQCV